LLYAWLAERFGPARVFWDREDIEPGEDFRKALSTQLRGCDALAALIGPGWSPSSWIQREIRAALERKILVLPILVGDIRNLSAESLPTSIRKLANLQSLETRDQRFRHLFIDALERVLPAAPDAHTSVDPRARRLAALLRTFSDDRHYQALEALEEGRTEDAFSSLELVFEALMQMLELEPGAADLQSRLGFVYKDFAQVFEQSDPARFDWYCKSGLDLFQALVKRQLGRDEGANAWNGLGNMHLLCNEFEEAEKCCRRAVTLRPDYGYAWSDLLLAYEGQARNGKVHLAEMRAALERLRATSKGVPMLQRAVEEHEAEIRRWDRRAVSPAKQRSRRKRTGARAR
jgi:tetratricopeptide (TPR) repeat protein